MKPSLKGVDREELKRESKSESSMSRNTHAQQSCGIDFESSDDDGQSKGLSDQNDLDFDSSSSYGEAFADKCQANDNKLILDALRVMTNGFELTFKDVKDCHELKEAPLKFASINDIK